METLKEDLIRFGKKLGTLTVTKNDAQGTIIVTFDAKPDPDLEVRTSICDGKGGIETTLKKKES